MADHARSQWHHRLHVGKAFDKFVSDPDERATITLNELDELDDDAGKAVRDRSRRDEVTQ